MVGISYLENFGAGDADLTRTISKLGYNDTPLFNAITKGIPSKSGESWKGHSWRYETAPDGDDNNAHVEGSGPSTANSADLGSSSNHYQIIKHTYGISGSMEGKTRTDGSNELANEGADAVIRHRKTIEKMLFSVAAPRQGDKDATVPVAGLSGGINHWCVAENTLPANGSPLSIKLLRNLLKIAYLQGQTITHIFMDDVQKDALDDILSDKNQVNILGANVLEGTNYTTLSNMAYAPNVKIIMSPNVTAGEIISMNLKDVALVYQRLSKTYELARTADSMEKELISEVTLRVNNPFAVGKMTGLAV